MGLFIRSEGGAYQTGDDISRSVTLLMLDLNRGRIVEHRGVCVCVCACIGCVFVCL